MHMKNIISSTNHAEFRRYDEIRIPVEPIVYKIYATHRLGVGVPATNVIAPAALARAPMASE